jgi:hypothetical protein
VPGTGPPFYLRLWEVEGARLGASVVVVGLFVGNDFFDEQGRPEGWRGRVDQAAAVSFAVRLARNLLRLEGPVARPPGASGARHPSGGFDLSGYVYDDTRATFSHEAFAEVERDRMTLCLRSAGGRFATRLERVVRVLRELDAQVRRSGARLVVMMIPDEYQVHADMARLAARAEGQALDAYDLDLPQRELGLALRNEGVDALDLLPAFRERGTAERLYVPRDTHWNRAGHRLAAEQLAAHLERSRP